MENPSLHNTWQFIQRSYTVQKTTYLHKKRCDLAHFVFSLSNTPQEVHIANSDRMHRREANNLLTDLAYGQSDAPRTWVYRGPKSIFVSE